MTSAVTMNFAINLDDHSAAAVFFSHMKTAMEALANMAGKAVKSVEAAASNVATTIEADVATAEAAVVAKVSKPRAPKAAPAPVADAAPAAASPSTSVPSVPAPAPATPKAPATIADLREEATIALGELVRAANGRVKATEILGGYQVARIRDLADADVSAFIAKVKAALAAAI